MTCSRRSSTRPRTSTSSSATSVTRSIYSLWRQVLEYVDAFLIGLTAALAKHTFGFFNKTLVTEYGHEQAVVDRVNVDLEIYKVRTKIIEGGSTIEAEDGTMTAFARGAPARSAGPPRRRCELCVPRRRPQRRREGPDQAHRSDRSRHASRARSSTTACQRSTASMEVAFILVRSTNCHWTGWKRARALQPFGEEKSLHDRRRPSRSQVPASPVHEERRARLDSAAGTRHVTRKKKPTGSLVRSSAAE